MNEILLFFLLLALGFACYGLFYLSIKFFDKI